MLGRRKDGAAPAAGPGRAQLAYASFMNSNKTWYAALGFMVLLLVGVVFVFLPFGGAQKAGEPTTVPVIATVVPEAPPTSAADGTVNGCAPQEAEVVPPEKIALAEFQTDWKPIGSMSIPGSYTGGPLVQEPYYHCFVRSPEGSLYAAATFVAERAQAQAVSNEETVAVMAQRCLHDGNYELYTARLLADTRVTGEPPYVINGYRWAEYSPGRAQIELRLRLTAGAPPGTTTSVVVSVLWANNDWLVLSPNPDQPTKLQGDNLRTFHTWGDS